MAISLKPGTIVQLKSGGPRMTVAGERIVQRLGSGQVICQWFDGDKITNASFPEASLIVVESVEQPLPSMQDLRR